MFTARSRILRGGFAALILVLVFLGALFVMTFATSFQSESTSRSYSRAVLNRHCLEVGQSAFAESAAVVMESIRLGRPVDARTSDSWKELLLPPRVATGVTGRVDPARTREAIASQFVVEIPEPVTVEVINWVTGFQDAILQSEGAGVLEMRVSMRGQKAKIGSENAVKQRFEFYVRGGQVYFTSSPLGTVIE